MSTLDNSLRCLKHPATIVSIVLLVINDHILKILAPSWLTGKLSDFAGVFFFPFLLAIVFDAFRISPRFAGAIAFSITGIWFALIKTTAWGIALTQDLFFPVLGYRAPIVLDPTDLIALVVLLPAWRLWNQAARVARPGKLAWAMLGVASLATLATSCPYPPGKVERVVAAGQTVYASGWFLYTSASEDGGRTWGGASHGSVDWEQGAKLPRVECEKANPQICYRISQPDQVEESRDAGKTWRVAWSIASRREFMRRVLNPIAIINLCSQELDLKLYDLATVEVQGASFLVVAVGNQGVVVRAPNGTWTRHAVSTAVPTPESAAVDGAGDLIFKTIQIESLVASIASVIAFTLTKALRNFFVTLIGLLAPFLLWAYGVIANYEIALILAIVLPTGYFVVYPSWVEYKNKRGNVDKS